MGSKAELGAYVTIPKTEKILSVKTFYTCNTKKANKNNCTGYTGNNVQNN